MQYSMHNDLRPSSLHPNLHSHEGGFSSAFGLMSIDDPNVVAGMATDGAPFFSTAAMNMAPLDPNTTPMPSKHSRVRDGLSASLPTPGLAREAETRELRDFWKQYIQTPPGGSALGSPAQLGLLPNQRPPNSPNGSRRARVSSMPGAQTPTSDDAKYVNGGRSNIPPTNGNATSSIRTTLHGNADDLRSYEAAVLARKTPTLNLVHRKKRGSMSGSSTGPPNPSSRAIPEPPAASLKSNSALGRPSSSSSTSSLAYALDLPSMPRSSVAFGSETASFASPPSRDSSVSEEALSDRPSFKRLPSQTLGPARAKRALLSNGVDEHADVSAVSANANTVTY